MESRNSSPFTRLFKKRESNRVMQELMQLQQIADNQRAAVLVRLYEEGKFMEVQRLSAASN